MRAGHPALDLVGTVAERTTTHVEHLTTPEQLARWLVAADLLDTVPTATATDLAAAAGPAVVLTLDAAGALHRDGDVAAALSTVARAAIELIGGPDRHLVRW